jgi:hypothetical protein
MGYYSDVTIVCEENAYRKIREVWKKYPYDKPTGIYKTDSFPTPSYVLKWEWLKWYLDFPAVEETMDVINALDESNEEGDGYKYIRIGEDNETDVQCNESGSELYGDFYLEVKTSLPSDMAEITDDDTEETEVPV